MSFADYPSPAALIRPLAILAVDFFYPTRQRHNRSRPDSRLLAAIAASQIQRSARRDNSAAASSTSGMRARVVRISQ